ncbi:hypothetical protein [Streptomyces sp. NBC_01727]|uniref:hypothetical protein n=1 Tax=Streptomyces sp. NBC_01727 TaxID=2975924 RepID=UPI002E10D622|nr:hypothetical protein OIE76_07205 [Streptomyces sp. NBC_01727]
MQNRAQRLVRARLARRRPGPGRVRARQTRPRRWWNRADWTKIGTITAIFFGITTVAATAVATYYGAVVAKDQLEQSQEDAERAVREQASRVSFWKVSERTGLGLHVMNRSPDPVTNVVLRARVALRRGDGKLVAGDWSGLRLALEPCSVTIFEWDKLRLGADGKRWLEAPDQWKLVEIRVTFADRDGTVWERREDGSLKHPADPKDALDYTFKVFGGDDAYVGEPKVKPVPECSSGSGG